MLGGLHPALGFVSAGFTGFLRSCPFGVVPVRGRPVRGLGPE